MRALPLLLLLLACDVFPDTTTCAESAECGAGFTCDPASHACVVSLGDGGGAEPLSATLSVQAASTPKVDMLFVIDDSGSMCEEQAALAQGFGQFGDVLLKANLDLRLAVISTDMKPENGRAGRFLNDPAPPVPSLNCRDEQGDPLAPDTEDCADLELSTVLELGGVEDAADFARRFRCMATVGTSGDGYEMGLEAMRVALSCSGPNRAAFGGCCGASGYDPGCADEPSFLRPEAALVVLVLSDEDDCSEPAANPRASRQAICRYGLDDDDGDGIPDGFGDSTLCGRRTPAECFAAQCGDLTAEECAARCHISRSENANCEWFRDTLTPVADYVDFLKSRKRDPAGQLLVVTMVGERLYLGEGDDAYEVSFNHSDEVMAADECGAFGEWSPEACCDDRGRCVGSIVPSCESPWGQAFAGKRYLEFAEGFGRAGLGCPRGAEANECLSICRDPREIVAEHLQHRLVDAFLSNTRFCLPEALPAERPGCRVDGRRCTTDAERADPENYEYRLSVKCDEGCDASFDGALHPSDELCASRFALEFARPLPPGATATMRYTPDADPTVRVLPAADTPVRIPDGEGSVRSTVNVEEGGQLSSLAIHATITHGERSDLSITLRHGEDPPVELYDGDGDRGENLERVFDASMFAGQPATGTWTLEVRDLFPADEGVLESWALELTTE